MKQPDSFDPWGGRWLASTPIQPDELRQWQLERAWRVAETSAATNPFYAQRLRLPKERTAEAFAKLGMTTKDEVVEDCSLHPPYGSRSVCSPNEVRHFVETSGTSGQGQEVYPLSADDEQATFRAEAVGFAWAGVGAGSRVMLTLPVGTRAAGIWYYHGLRLLGANVICAGTYRTEQKVELLRRYGADLLIATPSYLQRLANACREAGAKPADFEVQSLMVSGEGYGLGWAHDVERVWNAKLFEQYGCTERAFAWACPFGSVRDDAMGTLHFPPEMSYCEVIDPGTGQQVGDGEVGELVVTPLQAEASPLVRFATRDRVRWVAPGACDCGRPLAGIEAGGVQRYDDMMKVRGINIWPLAMDRVILGFPGIVEYRGSVTCDDTGREHVVVHLETTKDVTPDVATEVQDAIRRSLGLGVEVLSVEPGSITSNVPEGFVKVRRWQDERSRMST